MDMQTESLFGEFLGVMICEKNIYCHVAGNPDFSEEQEKNTIPITKIEPEKRCPCEQFVAPPDLSVYPNSLNTIGLVEIPYVAIRI